MNKQKSPFQQQERHFSSASYLTPTTPHGEKYQGTSTIKNRVRTTMIGLSALLCLFMATSAQAFVPLNLIPGIPDIASPAQIDVTYTFDAPTGIGTLIAFGGASQLNLPPSQSITGGIFTLNAIIDTINTTATGDLTINGTSSGFTNPLLTSITLDAFGAGANDPLEFLFSGLGGSTASIYGPIAGVILSNTGFTGSLTSDFGTGGSFAASADTFGVPPARVPEPGTLALILLGSGTLAYTRRKQRITRQG